MSLSHGAMGWCAVCDRDISDLTANDSAWTTARDFGIYRIKAISEGSCEDTPECSLLTNTGYG